MTQVDPHQRDIERPGKLCTSQNSSVSPEDHNQLATGRGTDRLDRQDCRVSEVGCLIPRGTDLKSCRGKFAGDLARKRHGIWPTHMGDQQDTACAH
jgi:hypothetical protein